MTTPTDPIRRRNAAATKQRILAAAKQCFSEIGYATAGIRDVARVAGISYALVGRYYGSKAGLLEAALEDMLTIEPMIDVERSRFGEKMAETLAKASVTDTTSAMTVLAAADPVARAVATRLLETRIIQPLAAWLGPPFEHDRAVAIIMIGAGFSTHARLVPLLNKQPALNLQRPVVQWLAHALQGIVDEPENWRTHAESKPEF